MDTFTLVKIVSNVLMLVGYVIALGVMIYGLIQCFTVQDQQVEEQSQLETLSDSDLVEEKELHTFPESNAKKPARTDLLTGDLEDGTVCKVSSPQGSLLLHNKSSHKIEITEKKNATILKKKEEPMLQTGLLNANLDLNYLYFM